MQLHELIIKRALSEPETRVAADKVVLLVSGSPKLVSKELVLKLSMLSNFVLAVDSGAELLATACVTPDLLLGDFDSIDADVLENMVGKGVATEAHNAYKDATDTELALDYIVAQGFMSVIATNVLGGRIDHELATIGCFAKAAQEGKKVIIAGDDEVCVFLEAGRESAKLNLAFDELKPSFISLVPWGGNATVSITGVEWELDKATLSASCSLGISNEPRSKNIAITAHRGTVMAIFQINYL